MKTSIRQANTDDLDPIRILFRDTVVHINSKDYNQEEINVWADGYKNIEGWKKNISQQYFLVAETNRQIVGFASVADSGYLDYLYIHKDFQRKGIAKKLLAAIERHAEKLSLKEISAHVSKTAKPFFEANGFVKTGDLKKTVQNIEFVNSIMVKTFLLKSDCSKQPLTDQKGD